MTDPQRGSEAAPSAQFSFYVSSEINAQVQLGIDKLIGCIPSYKDPELAPGGIIRPSSLYATALLCDEFDALGVPSTTHYIDADDQGCIWNSFLTFAPKYRDLLPSSQIAITVYEIREGHNNPTILCGTTFPLFSKKGRLKTGQHTLQTHLHRPGSTCYPSSTPSKVPLSHRGHIGQIEKSLKRYHRGELEHIDWLDDLSIHAAEKILRDAQFNDTDRNHIESSKLKLCIHIPEFPLPVIYQDSVVQHTTTTTNINTNTTTPTTVVSERTGNALSTPLPGTSGSGIIHATPSLTSHFGQLFQNTSGKIILVQDPEIGKETPAEIKAQKLARSLGRGLIMDSGLRPNTAEKERIESILELPPGRPLSRDDRELLWRFRFALIGEKKALARFLKCVDWSDAAETAQATELLRRWAQISVAEALELLSPDFPIEVVRAHAVYALESTSDEELLLYLLQLVQALRYEPLDDSQLALFLLGRSEKSTKVASAFFWYLCAELDDASFGPRAERLQGALLGMSHGAVGSRDQSPAPSSSSSSSPPSASDVSAKRGRLGQMHSTTPTVPVDCIPLQLKLLARLRHLADAVKLARTADKKTEVMRSLLDPGGACSDLSVFECPCPLEPSVELKGIVPGECSVFKSKVNPLKITFRVDNMPANAIMMVVEGVQSNGDDTNGNRQSGSDNTNAPVQEKKESIDTDKQHLHLESIATPPATVSLLYKKGDDLRQDQLVLQMITLMDRLLKKEHLDLRITAYRVLPTSASDGLIEFVPNSLPLSQVLRIHGTVQRYLGQCYRDQKGQYRLEPSVLNNYVRSCAGSTVLTHILGVGDRHMDNIMLTADGRLFHIDFGYFLGKDPKFTTAPMVLTRAIVDGMGGAESANYREFVQLCGEAYNILRKNSNLLLSLVHLMAGSSIPDIHVDAEKALLKVQERLRLDLNDEEASAFMEEMLTAAQAAVLVRVAEVQHRVAQGWR